MFINKCDQFVCVTLSAHDLMSLYLSQDHRSDLCSSGGQVQLSFHIAGN